MASFVELRSLILLVLLFFTVSLQVHAREGQFFGKTPRSEEDPSMSYDDDDTFTDRSNGIPSTLAGEFNGGTERNINGNVPSSFDREPNYEDAGRNVDGVPSGTSSAGDFPSKAFSGNREYHDDANNNIPRQYYGMSDTRFLENGKYFYDVDAERNHGQYGPANARGNARGHGSMYGGNYRSDVAGHGQNYRQKSQDEFYDP